MSTSLKHLALVFEDSDATENAREFAPWRRFFSPNDRGQAHKRYPTRSFETTQVPPNALHIAVVRHPYARFISTYESRVRNKRKSDAAAWRKISLFGLPDVPTPTFLIDNIGEYMRRHPPLRHHLLPQTHFLGVRAKMFEQVFRMTDLNPFRTFLEALMGTSIHLPHKQRSERSTIQLNDCDKRKLDAIYRSDFETYGRFM